MNIPTVFATTFIASVKAEYIDYGVNGYTIGTTNFRSIASLTTGLISAFSVDMGEYRYLEAQIIYNIGTEKHQAICNVLNYEEVIEAITTELEGNKITMDDLLGE